MTKNSITLHASDNSCNQLPIGTHRAFETQGIHHQKFKTGAASLPHLHDWIVLKQMKWHLPQYQHVTRKCPIIKDKENQFKNPKSAANELRLWNRIE